MVAQQHGRRGTPPRARGSRRVDAGEAGLGRNTPACAGITSATWGCPARSQEHPRVRGDHVFLFAKSRRYWGTPPRARGSHHTSKRHRAVAGNTPACAGITLRRIRRRRRPTEHPRVRGDHTPLPHNRNAAVGTPPRARGSQDRQRQRHLEARNTPACAGITVGSLEACRSSQEHPRVRGDHGQDASVASAEGGTPPRARGSRPPRRALAVSARNTPACAGITCGPALRAATAEEHPRVRGDHDPTHPYEVRLEGTPPRARGSRILPGGLLELGGNTPACAGITRADQSWIPTTREHPRVRGDHGIGCSMILSRFGTPPRARGSPGRIRRDDAAGGNTPACAGITAHGAGHATRPGEHPRVRGDHPRTRLRTAPTSGTPPRARGSLDPDDPDRRPGGNTPACAGITRLIQPTAHLFEEHPRVRGDHHVEAYARFIEEGTPPRARGSQPGLLVDPAGYGNTPACAGITTRTPCASRRAREHPRVRGDHAPAAAGSPQEGGTPPRARGSLRLRGTTDPRVGNTPACAGITLPASQRSTVGSEHPRVRGDHGDSGRNIIRGRGTPPRARGSHVQRPLHRGPDRNTPACAGIPMV